MRSCACGVGLLSRLNKVKSTGANKWKACCPAHDDKHPSLAITETSDGTVLVRCWSGCSADSIVRAIGLKLRDLFPSNTGRARTGPSKAAIAHERTVYEIGRAIQASGSRLSEEDQCRFELAKKRLGAE